MSAPGPPMPPSVPPTEAPVEVSERGANRHTSHRRLFIQLHVFTGTTDLKGPAAALGEGGIEAALYADAADPRGMGLLVMHEDVAFFPTRLRELLAAEPFAGLTHRSELTMFGRTYSSGFEADLDDWLLRRPRRTVLNPAWPWAVWYPLRRVGAFAQLSREEQGAILREHATLGRRYGEANLAHDIRLACHGLDVHDNDFVIGLVGRDLHPLSHLIQAMRHTAQTAQYIQSLGPFFVGHAFWQSPLR
jgi:hypothetical protein